MSELWKGVIGYEERYEVSDLGRVRNKRSRYVLKAILHHSGYYIVNLYLGGRGTAKTFTIHGIVGRGFLNEPEPETVINHKDGNRLNNVATNLEYISWQNNIKHAFALGLSNQKGERNNNAKLSYEIAEEIRSLGKGVNTKMLADKYGVSTSAIYNIRNTENYWRK